MDTARRADRVWFSRTSDWLSIVWVVFLVVQMVFTIQTPRPVAWRAAAVGVLAVFLVVYVVCWVSAPDEVVTSPRLHRHAVWALGSTGALAVLSLPVIGGMTVVFAPYLTALAVWMLPFAWGVWVGAALAALPFAFLLMPGVDDLEPAIVMADALVLFTGVIGRTLMLRDEEQRELARVLTVSAERDRVARDVHDVLGHSLTAVTVKADLARRLVHRDPDRAEAELEEIQALTRAALAEIRSTVTGLRAAVLADELTGARHALQAAGVELDVEGEVADVDPSLRPLVAWAVREGVTNVVRHSGARLCVIRLRSDGVEIEDDGRGRRGRAEGNGLRGLRERVAGGGGAVEVGSRPDGTGTLLRVAVGHAEPGEAGA